MSVTRHERGWAGHFAAAHDCSFRRNTLIKRDGRPVFIVSTVGCLLERDNRGGFEIIEIGADRFYETMVFRAGLRAPFYDVEDHDSLDFDTPESEGTYPEMDEYANGTHENMVLKWMTEASDGQE